MARDRYEMLKEVSLDLLLLAPGDKSVSQRIVAKKLRTFSWILVVALCHFIVRLVECSVGRSK